MAPRQGELWIQRQRLSQLFDRLEVACPIGSVGLLGLKKPRVRIEIAGRALLDPALLRRREIGVQGTRDLLRDLALNREHVREIAIVPVRPERLLCRGVHELGAHTHAIAVHPNAAVHQVAKT